MTKLLLRSVLVFALFSLVVIACSSATPVSTPAPSGTASTTVVQKPDWEKKWEIVLAEARKEGEIMVYGNVIPATREALIRGFKDRFGINLDILILIGPEGASKLNAEYRGGVHRADVLIAGPAVTITMLKPEQNAGPMEPLLVLPEVRDPKAWADGRVPFVDKEAQALPLIRGYQPGMVRNTDLVKDGELASYKDLLKPQWKGKVIMFDPTIVGAGSAGLTSLMGIWNYVQTMDYIRGLVKQDVTITRDYRAQVEQVSRGKYSVALWARAENIIEFLDLGAPVATVKLGEPGLVTSGASGVAMPKKPAHPNGAIVFLNWLLSREGQTIYSRTLKQPGVRADIPAPEGLRADALPPAGEKPFLNDTEENILIRPKLMSDADAIIKGISK